MRDASGQRRPSVKNVDVSNSAKPCARLPEKPTNSSNFNTFDGI